MNGMEAIRKFSIDKSDWKKVRLGDVVFEPKESVKDPVVEGIEHVVGLEHIDSEDIHLRRSESLEEGTTFTKRFGEGDVLFGRRRAYLKKAAKADFEGICSGDITVMRARDCILSELMPFLINNERFFDYAVTHSAGGLSPRVKFKDLANYELLLPDKARQNDLLQLLTSLDNSLELEFKLEREIYNLKSARQRLYFDCDELNKIEIGAISKVYSGGTPSRKAPEYWGGDIPWIKTAEVNYNIIDSTEEYITDIGIENSAAKLMPVNTVLLAMYGQGITRGRVALTGIEAACNQACAAIEVNEDFLPEFLYFYLEYKYEELRELAHGANQQNLNLGMVKNFKIPNINKSEQSAIVESFKNISKAMESSRRKNNIGKVLMKHLINQAF